MSLEKRLTMLMRIWMRVSIDIRDRRWTAAEWAHQVSLMYLSMRNALTQADWDETAVLHARNVAHLWANRKAR